MEVVQMNQNTMQICFKNQNIMIPNAYQDLINYNDSIQEQI